MAHNQKTKQANKAARKPAELADEALDKAAGGANAHEMKKSLIGNFPG